MCWYTQKYALLPARKQNILAGVLCWVPPSFAATLVSSCSVSPFHKCNLKYNSSPRCSPSGGPGVSTGVVCSQWTRTSSHSREPSLAECTGQDWGEPSQMDLHGRGDRWGRNPPIIVCVTARIFPLLIINLVLAGNGPIIRMAVNHWSHDLRRVRAPVCP